MLAAGALGTPLGVALLVRLLVMQAPQDPALGAGMVVLHEEVGNACRAKLFEVVGLEEEAAIIGVDFGLDDEDARQDLEYVAMIVDSWTIGSTEASLVSSSSALLSESSPALSLKSPTAAVISLSTCAFEYLP